MKKRVFIAIDLSEETKNKVSDYLQTLCSESPQVRVGWEGAETQEPIICQRKN